MSTRPGEGTIEENVLDVTAIKRAEAVVAEEFHHTKILQDLGARLVTEENIQTIYEEILTAAIEITGAVAGTVQILDEEKQELVVLATRGFSQETVDYFQRVDASSNTSCGLALRTGVRSFFEFDPTSMDYAIRRHVEDGVLSAQCSPLTSRAGKPIGMVSTHWREAGHRPSERELRFLDLLVRQAADIIEQRSAEEALRERAAWVRGQSEALQTAVNDAPLETSLGVLVRTAVEALGDGTRAAFYLGNVDNTTLHHVVGMGGEYANALDGFKIGPESLTRGLPTHHGEPVLTTDVQTEPLWKPWCLLAERFGYRGCWSFPIHAVAGNFIGALAIYSIQPREATERELELASLLTNTAAIIIARHAESEARKREERQRELLNEQLEERVRERTRELEAKVHERRAGEERIKNLLRQLVNSEEQQRQRIARELHDTCGQQLAALHLTIEVLKAKAEGDADVHENIQRMREVFDQLNSSVDFLAWELRPPNLDLLGLDAALESYVKEWSQQFGVDAGYEGVGVRGLRLADEVETNLYRIFQEALQNVHKHAGADRVNVVFERRDGHAVLIIEDDGKGYEAEALAGHGMGLINMRERAALIDGSVEIESQIGQGTTIFVTVPVGGGNTITPNG